MTSRGRNRRAGMLITPKILGTLNCNNFLASEISSIINAEMSFNQLYYKQDDNYDPYILV
jgi:hypothetical protein